MKTDTKAHIWSAGGTAVTACVALLIFFTIKLAATPEAPQPVEGSIALADDFIEIIDQPPAPPMPGDDPAAALGDPNAQAQPAPVSGTDQADAGAKGDPKPLASTETPSPMTESKVDNPGPTKQEEERQKDERQVQEEVANAFGASSGRHNTQAGEADQANAGRTDAATSVGSYDGLVTGKAGGGWGIPAYAPVKSNATGEIRMKVTINRQGKPENVEIIGGTAPVSTNRKVRQDCVDEVKRHTFTRPNADDAPDLAIAIITYSFR